MLDEDTINKLKRLHGEIYEIVVTQEGKDDETFIFKKPTMTTLSACARYEDEDPIKSAQIMFNDTLVEGRKEAVEDVDVFPVIMRNLRTTIGGAKATLKKL